MPSDALRFWIGGATFLVGATLPVLWALTPNERVVHTSSMQLVPMPTPVAVVHEVEVEVERPMPRPPVLPTKCPAPRRDVPAGKLMQPPEEIEHVRPSSTNSGWVAAWNADHVYVSRNGGASWKLVPAGEDNQGVVRDVDFDCFGRVLAVRGSVPGIDDDSDLVVLGGGPDMVVTGKSGDVNMGRIAVSADGGATWHLRDLMESWETPVYGRQYEDGTIATIAQQGDCGGQAPYSFAFDRALGTIKSSKLAVYEDLLGREEKIDGVDGYYRDTHVIEGPFPMLVANGHAYRYLKDKDTATELPLALSEDAWYYRTDAAGRLWGIACGGVAIAPATRGSGPRAGSSDAAAAKRCDPS